ncbi:MAG: hypothetical protein ACT4OK_08790 [Gemmobacter sp.]
MARSLILHIGAPKAGSTYLQRVLLRNADRLAAAGVAYPHDDAPHPGNAEGIGTLDRAGFDALFASGARTVVLSHETLFANEKEAAALVRLARRARVTVRKLVFLRPWSEFCIGDFSQHLKQNFERYLAERRAFDGLGFEEMAEQRAAMLDPAGYFICWSRLIPLPALTVASHRAIRPVVETMLGNPGLDWTLHRHLTNPSLRLCDCEAVAALINDPSVPEEDVRAAFRAAHHHTDDPDEARTPDRMARVEAMFALHNQALMDIYQFDNRLRAPV